MTDNTHASMRDSRTFPTILAGHLRVGGLIQRADGGYLLIAHAVLVDGVVELIVYDCDHPDGASMSCHPGDRVLLACRDLIELDDGSREWTDARWRRAYRRAGWHSP